MKFLTAFLASVFLTTQCDSSPFDFFESSNLRVKRADCTSEYGEWTDWSQCSMDCGYCGKQTRNRTCTAVAGCDDVTCTGDSSETQDCGTNRVICLYPSSPCCDKNYKKMIDWNLMTFVCMPKDSTPMAIPARYLSSTTTSKP